MKIEINDKIIMEICLSADGGCLSCAIDVLNAFENHYPEIDYENIKKLIQEKYKSASMGELLDLGLRKKEKVRE